MRGGARRAARTAGWPWRERAGGLKGEARCEDSGYWLGRRTGRGARRAEEEEQGARQAREGARLPLGPCAVKAMLRGGAASAEARHRRCCELRAGGRTARLPAGIGCGTRAGAAARDGAEGQGRYTWRQRRLLCSPLGGAAGQGRRSHGGAAARRIIRPHTKRGQTCIPFTRRISPAARRAVLGSAACRDAALACGLRGGQKVALDLGSRPPAWPAQRGRCGTGKRLEGRNERAELSAC